MISKDSDGGVIATHNCTFTLRYSPKLKTEHFADHSRISLVFGSEIFD